MLAWTRILVFFRFARHATLILTFNHSLRLGPVLLALCSRCRLFLPSWLRGSFLRLRLALDFGRRRFGIALPFLGLDRFVVLIGVSISIRYGRLGFKLVDFSVFFCLGSLDAFVLQLLFPFRRIECDAIASEKVA